MTKNDFATIKLMWQYQSLAKYLSDAVIERGARYYWRNSQDRHANMKSGMKDFWSAWASNPYQCAVVPYLTLPRIDKIVTGLLPNDICYVDLTDQRRIDAMLTAMFDYYLTQGVTVLKREDVLMRTYEVLCDNTPADKLTATVKADYVTGLKNTQAGYAVQLPGIAGLMSARYYQTMQALVDNLAARSQLPMATVVEDRLQRILQGLQLSDGTPLGLDETQIQAVRNLIQQPLNLLTGYAGTGKSTLLKAVVDYLVLGGHRVQLCAWSGKACFNLLTMTGQPAKTISSLLFTAELGRSNGELMQCEYLIIDEISMVPEDKLWRLLRLVPVTCHLIMVGDKAQLPAVKAVGVLTSLLAFVQQTDRITWTNLTHVYRNQGALLHDATLIRDQQPPHNFKPVDKTLTYLTLSQRQSVVDLYVEATLKYGHHDSVIICPTNADVNYFNQHVQAQYQKQYLSQTYGGMMFGLYDKVLVTHNQYHVATVDMNTHELLDATTNVFNGFVGEVVHLGRDFVDVLFKQITVVDDTLVDSVVRFFVHPATQQADMTLLTLGYAMTVHKSQGSTIDIVFCYLPDANLMMMNRQLLYTAYTRAKQLLVITPKSMTTQFLAPIVQRNVYAPMNSILGPLWLARLKTQG